MSSDKFNSKYFLLLKLRFSWAHLLPPPITISTESDVNPQKSPNQSFF